jgi:hypothetical protein
MDNDNEVLFQLHFRRCLSSGSGGSSEPVASWPSVRSTVAPQLSSVYVDFFAASQPNELTSSAVSSWILSFISPIIICLSKDRYHRFTRSADFRWLGLGENNSHYHLALQFTLVQIQ